MSCLDNEPVELPAQDRDNCHLAPPQDTAGHKPDLDPPCSSAWSRPGMEGDGSTRASPGKVHCPMAPVAEDGLLRTPPVETRKQRKVGLHGAGAPSPGYMPIVPLNCTYKTHIARIKLQY